MTTESNWWFTPVPPDTVPVPTTGYYAYFMSDGTASSVSGATTALTLYRKTSVTGAVVAIVNPAFTTEDAQDAVGNILVDSTSIDFTYDDAGGTITAVIITEAIQDIVGALLSAADSTITVTYTDASNTLTIGVNSITSAKVSDFTEATQDAVGAMLADSSEIDVTYNDAGNAETLTLIDNTIARARLVQPAQARILGRASAAGTGVVTDLLDDDVLRILTEDVATRSIVASTSLTAITTEQVLATFSLPSTWAGPVGAVYELYAAGRADQTAAGVAGSFRLRVGAAGVGTGGLLAAQENSTTPVLARSGAQWTVRALLTIRTNGAGGTCLGSIEAGGQFMRGAVASTAASAIGTAVAVNTTIAQDVLLSWSWAAATVSNRFVDTAFIHRVA